MTLLIKLNIAEKKLSVVSKSPLLDAQVLMGFVLQKDRCWVLAHPDYVLQCWTLQSYNDMFDRSVLGEPVADIS